ncbi:MAG: TspO/MBR family protein [Limnohabitans sp.]|nr:TspO/MBR family protein [Limnohabitans sp.]
MTRANITKLGTSIAICLAIGLISSLASKDSINTWYLTIEKPIFNPPSWMFAPVWTILYILMGYSFAILWSRRFQSRRSRKVMQKATILFGIQLVLNALWSYLFFGLCNPFLALIEILLLWLLILETFKAFQKIDSFAAKLLVPYIVWVSFAVVLNGSIWYINS